MFADGHPQLNAGVRSGNVSEQHHHRVRKRRRGGRDGRIDGQVERRMGLSTMGER